MVLGDPSTGKGTVYIIFGKKDWSSVIAAGSMSINSADVIIAGGDTSGWFGGGRGAVSLPDLEGPGANGLLVQAEFAGKAYLFKGSALVAAGNTASTSDAFLTLQASSVSDFPFGAATADVNGDGLLDVILGSSDPSGQVFVYPGSGSTWNTTPTLLATGTAFGASLLAADLNGDGKRDLFVSGHAKTAQSVNAYWSPMTLTTQPGSVLTDTVPSFGFDMSAGDVFKHNKKDLVIGEPYNGNGTVKIIY